MKRKTPHPPAIGRGDAGSTVSGQQRADAPPGEPLRIYKPPKNDASEKSGGVTPIFGQIVLRFRTNRFADYRLYISPRTLQDYRDRKIIPYTQFAGKILYKASDLERILEENYRGGGKR